ncbi:hypothetical protein ETAA8_05650 [Anatilimnocola aggregata]|uniref:Right handed beta helix domain-containing protein n=1 Tax=Anatilimnocola aggregata TaxID=2528021 RepID=A0A517Y5M0_9BACT|nr:hypothetical protein [Anatilimnocola aggregata]QDU25496.1 hypothetical protein ETAA8_05650 [Anatilimnocola aggregata]
MNDRIRFLLTFVWLLLAVSIAPGAEYRSHPPQRPLPTPTKGELAVGPKLFVDATRGHDSNAGTEAAPWRSLRYAARKVQPGDTIYLRGGTYYEHVALVRSGTAEAPITIASYPGELAILDGGLREFAEDPAGSWRPLPDGAEGEYISAKSYFDADTRLPPHQFLPGAWEPMWGIEDERPLALGNFADSLVPLHGYRTLKDLRSPNEYWLGNKQEIATIGLYGGPGMWFNRQTGRVHIRLAHNQLAGLGKQAYRGETDPRRVPLIVALGFGANVLRLTGIKHVTIQGLVLRGATGSPLIHVYGSENIELDHLTVYGGFPALLVNATKSLRVTNSAFRGLAAPWTSRAHMKYRGTASYQIVLQNNQPLNDDIELAWCEFTDDHDFAYLRCATNLRFHHNLVDNFNDDGLESGPKLRAHTLFISQNRIGACLIPFSQHEIDKDESPVDHTPETGVFVYRNVIDLRRGTYKSPPKEADATGSYLHEEGHLVGDHGGPTWPVLRFYHNTTLRKTPVFRDYFLFGLGAQGLRNTERDVLNNIFVQAEQVPGAGFAGIKEPGNVRAGGNLLWGLKEGPELAREPFAKFRASPLFIASRKYYEPGLTTHDKVADPKFVAYSVDSPATADLHLQPDSPALNSGLKVPAAWPDPLRDADQAEPDIGAIPHGAPAWGVGVDGRISLFTGEAPVRQSLRD